MALAGFSNIKGRSNSVGHEAITQGSRFPLTVQLPLVITRSADRELERHPPTSQLPIDLRVRIQPVINATPLLLIQDDLEKLRAVLLGARSLADDLDGIDEVGEDGLVHGRERAAAGTLLRLRRARPVRAFRARQDAPHR